MNRLKNIHLLFFFMTVFSVMMKAQVTYTFPQRVQVGTLSPGIPNSERDPDENPTAALSPYIENFHPIGWSGDGKAAYMSWGEKKDGCYFGVLVYDAVRDTLAGKWFENMSGMTELDASQLPAYWKRDMDSIQPLLLHFGIIQSPVQQLFYFPFTLKNGYRYEMEFNIHQSKTDEHFFTGYDGNCVVSNTTSNDTLHFVCEGQNALDIQPTGIWFSPDHQFAFIINYAESAEKSIENPHYFTYFLSDLKLK